MRIVADENIPALGDYFGVFGEVDAVPGRALTPEQVREADVLLVRSVTRVDRALLAGSRVKFVGTCTIGTDHLDKAYLEQQGIAYASAPGCNAGGVVQYVLAALAHCRGDNWTGVRAGIVGCGNVGGRLYRTLEALGVDCLAYDPFLGDDSGFALGSLEAVLERELVCVHTPLTREGAHPTHHMIDAAALRRLPAGALLLNAGRGAAVDNSALLAHLRDGADLRVALDVWENEPEIDRDLARHVTLATPHIAGYSVEGKLKGSAMICEALANFLDWAEDRTRAHLAAVGAEFAGEGLRLNAPDLAAAVLATYPITRDHNALMAVVEADKPLGPAFDALRKEYPQRHEPGHYRLAAADADLRQRLTAVGFELEEG